MPSPFTTTRLVEFHDTDMAGIMHFSAFYQFMESAEHELLRSIGLSVQMHFGDELISFPRVSASCEFLSPARFEQLLEIAISIERIGEKSVTYAFHFSHQGRAIAEGKMTSVCCLIEAGKPPKSRPIPAEIANKLTAFAA